MKKDDETLPPITPSDIETAANEWLPEAPVVEEPATEETLAIEEHIAEEVHVDIALEAAQTVADEAPALAVEAAVEETAAPAEEPVALEAAPAEEIMIEEPAAVIEEPAIDEIAVDVELEAAPAAEEEAPALAAEEAPAEEPAVEEAPRSTVEIPAANYVTFVDNPSHIHTLEISDAQSQEYEEIDDEANEDIADEETDEEEPLEVASSPEETEAQFENIAQAIAQEEARTLEESAELAAVDARDAAERLAEEIAEDEALAKQMAAEQEESMEEVDEELQAALPQADDSGNLDLAELQSCIEALLFMSDKPISAEKLQELLGPEQKLSIFQEAITGLIDRYKSAHHGFELVAVGGGFQFRTKPGRAVLARKLAKVQTQRLSSGGMESLAIIAYRQPVLKDEIDKIRGVDSSYFIRGLMEKKLIRISGRSELPGRPMLYSTTQEFLELFGLKELSAMPSLRELEQMVPASQSGNAGEEDPRIRQMRALVGQMNADVSAALKYNPREDEQILKEIRERVGAIPSSTPYLEELKQAEILAKQQAEQGIVDPAAVAAAEAAAPVQPELAPQV